MQKYGSRKLLLATALASLTLLFHPALAAQEPGTLVRSQPDVNVQSLSGAYLAAKSAQSAGALSVASDYYEKALLIDPTAIQLQREAMFTFLADGRFDRGVELAAKLRDDDDAGKVARIALGIEGLRDGDYDAALANLDMSDSSDLDTLLLGQLSAWADAGKGDPEAAVRRIDEIAGPPWFSIFNLYQKGLIYAQAGNVDEARRVLTVLLDDKASVQTSPDAYLAAVDALTRIELQAGNRDGAEKALAYGIEIAPTFDPLLHLERAFEANETVAPAIGSVRNGAAEVLYTLGQAINRGDGRDVALLYFELAEALSEHPADKLLTALAGVAEQGERVDQALAYYERIPADSPYRRTADLQMGLDLWFADRKDEAKARLEQAVAAYPDDLQAHLAYSDILTADKNYRRAAEILDRALELAPENGPQNWNIYYQRGIAYERLQEWDKAEPNFRKALELSPDQPQVLNYLGYSWVDMNRNLDEGLDLIRKAVELRPNDGYIIDSLGWAYYRLGRFDDAVKELERAVLITPAEPTVNDHLGDAYWRVGREREARFQWQRSLEGDPAPAEDMVEKIKVKLEKGLPSVADDPELQHPAADPAPADRADVDGGAQPQN
ncbi:tetratricopeptide repeat protein [Aureimonas frigidaquae]|uniref:tetratricopeptide repeat protein n=1 Tax=Aureimonas frigidaquae TaxID=424757 RepID=UPI0007841BE2|nr:tetratricopeptide repeat protein [Aureimonas frigidaquae]